MSISNKNIPESVVSVRLLGGLGNYMFQIAAAKAHALRFNKNLVLTTNDALTVHKHITTYKENIFKNVELEDSTGISFVTYNEPAFNYEELPPIANKSLLLNGYFQSEKYFTDYESDIRKLFNWKTDKILKVPEKLSAATTCSIHVRRGDYLKHPDIHPTQDINYYMKAIKKMPEDSVFFVFSDDIAWCKENFPELDNDRLQFVDSPGKDFDDLSLMSQCKNNIICNSSFSWWAAWLNENPDKIIVAPTKWFGPAAPHNTVDLYCDNWIKI